MMLLLALALPLIAAICCLGLNRFADTRRLGLGAAAALLASAGLFAANYTRLAADTVAVPWLASEQQTVVLELGYHAASLPLALLISAGGAVSLAALALALPAKLRGYGGLVAALMLFVATTLIGLAIREPLLASWAWAVLPLLAFVALRTSSTGNSSLAVGLLSNVLGAVLLLGAALSARFSTIGTATPDVALSVALLVGALAMGLPPFHRAIHDLAEAPANVAAPLLALGLPLLGGTMLVRTVADLVLTDGWRTALQLLGLLSLVVCATGAVGEQRLRRLIGWQMSAQASLLLLALGQRQDVMALVAPALLINLTLSTLAAMLAVALIERRAGTDYLPDIRLRTPLLLPGVATLIAAASSLGVPGTWGFWPLSWLIGELRMAEPLLVAPLLTGLLIMALAWMAPLVAFWRVAREQHTASTTDRGVIAWLPLLVVVPLAVFGVVPQFAWADWGLAARAALLSRPIDTLDPPSLPQTSGSLLAGCVLLALVLLPLLLHQRMLRHTSADQQATAAGVPAMSGLSHALRGWNWLGAPSLLWQRLWQGAVFISRGLSWAFSFLEQRYYMAGLMIALVAVILLLLQG